MTIHLIIVIIMYLIIMIAIDGLAGDREGDGLDVRGTHPEEPLPCEHNVIPSPFTQPVTYH